MTQTIERNRVIARQEVKLTLLSELHTAPWNPRTITRPRFKALMRSIASDPWLLWHRPVLANLEGEIHGGNMRFLAVAELWKRGCPGEPAIDWKANATLAGIHKGSIPAVVEDIDDEAARERAIRDNQSSGEWNDDQVNELMQRLAENGSDLTTLALDDEALANMSFAGPPETIPGSHEEEDPGDLSPPPEPVTRPGDLWTLGNLGHRLLCGDAARSESYARLLEGQRAAVCVTSPPYNVGGNTIPNGINGGTKKYANDDDLKDSDGYLSLLSAFTTEVLARCDLLALNIQPLAGNKLALIEYLYAFRDRYADMAVWDKEHAQPAMAAGVMNSQFELILFLSGAEKDPTRRFPKAVFHGTVTNVYKAPPQRTNEFATQNAATFPLHLPRWIMDEFSPGREPVLDPFIGTGTTLIAAEQTGRMCFGLDVEPGMVDVALRRWARFTGGDPVRQDGALWSELGPESPDDAE